MPLENPVPDKNPAVNSIGEPNKESSQSKPEVPPPAGRQNWWDKAKPFVEIAGLAILALYTTYTIKMYYANRDAADAATSAAKTAKDTLEEVQKGSTDTHELAVQAKNQADQTRDVAAQALAQAQAINRLAGEAKRSADTAKQSLAIQERPWVGYESLRIQPDIQANNFVESSLVVRNWGHGPAIHTEVEYMMRGWCGEDFPKHPPLVAIGPGSYATLMPGQTFSTANIRFPVTVPFDEAGIQALKGGKCILYAYARIRYSDISGFRHWRHFCSWWQPDAKTFIGCATYNDGDEDYPDGKEP